MMANIESEPDDVIVDGENGPQLTGHSCSSCGNPSFPPREYCPSCGSEDLNRLRFDRAATLETYTVIHVPQEGFEAPYSVGFARLSPGDVRVFGPLEADRESLEIGYTIHPTILTPETAGVPDRTWGFTVDGGDD